MLDPSRLHMLPREQNVDLMNDVEVYKDFTLIEKCPAIEIFQWVRRYTSPGQFLMTTSFTPEKFKQYAIGNIIYKRDNDEAAFIEGRRVIVTFDGDMRLIVTGRFLSSLLDRRIFTLDGDFLLQPMLSFIINNYFLDGAGANRSMAPLVRLLEIPAIGNELIHAEYRRHNVLDAISDLAQENTFGVRVNHNKDNRTYDIEFRKPTDSIAIFDKEWGNVLEQDYWDDTQNYKNVVLVGDSFIYNNHITGFDRREIPASEPRQGATRFVQTARDVLNRNRAVRTLSSRIDVNSIQFEYGKDWDLGSIVTVQNRAIGFTEKEVVTEVMEFFDETGRNIEVNTGDYVERGR